MDARQRIGAVLVVAGVALVAVGIAGAITTEDREMHVQVIDNVVYWFTDCGQPLA